MRCLSYSYKRSSQPVARTACFPEEFNRSHPFCVRMRTCPTSRFTPTQVVRDHVRNVGLSVVKDLQSKGGMDVTDDDGLRDDLHLPPVGGGKPNVTSDDVVTAMLEVWYMCVSVCVYFRGVHV